jgi:hypothetical protein
MNLRPFSSTEKPIICPTAYNARLDSTIKTSLKHNGYGNLAVIGSRSTQFDVKRTKNWSKKRHYLCLISGESKEVKHRSSQLLICKIHKHKDNLHIQWSCSGSLIAFKIMRVSHKGSNSYYLSQSLIALVSMKRNYSWPNQFGGLFGSVLQRWDSIMVSDVS